MSVTCFGCFSTTSSPPNPSCAAFGESDPARVSAAAHGLAALAALWVLTRWRLFAASWSRPTLGKMLPPGERVLADFEREHQSLRAAIAAYLESLGDTSN